MSEEDDVYTLQAKITQQQSNIRALKKSDPPTSADTILEEVGNLNDLRAKLALLTAGDVRSEDLFNRRGFDELIIRKMYVVPSFEIHNGPAGLFDYGPPACALKSNMLALWRRHFVLEESMLEMECTNLTPHAVLETSGHVERFTDFMTRDEVTGECFRADKLLEDGIDALLEANPHMPIQEKEALQLIQRQADAWTAEELFELFKKYNFKSPSNPENNLTMPFPFNLMFKTTIGPEGNSVGFLRPETAQGLFCNFRRLLDYNQAKMPFSAATIGIGFRNEIAPRNGLLRVREFCMAEIEHFVPPNEKDHPKFKTIAHKELVLFSNDAQLTTGRTSVWAIGDAVAKGLVANETLGYFMTRTQQWLEKIGVDPTRMRFRQHLKTEMAHYATDCWDMEIQMSYGWIECVGHADRACYDLEQHSKKTGVQMVASERLAVPLQVDRVIAEPNKKLLGPRFKNDQKVVIQILEAMDEDEVAGLQKELQATGKATIGEKYAITPELVNFVNEKKTIFEQKYTPSVIEPSFGIGRVLYAMLEHAFSQRNGDEQRCCMAFKPCVAPIKVGLFRLLNHAPFDAVISKLNDQLQASNLATRVDSSSGSVGRRYCRADELGIPFGVTVDFQTLLDKTVTVRDRDTMAQIRLPASEVLPLIKQLVEEVITWDVVMTRFRVVTTADEAAVAEGEDEGTSKSKDKALVVAVPVKKVTTVQYSTRGTFTRPAPLN
jgi:glycyl-tRNA synthetase